MNRIPHWMHGVGFFFTRLILPFLGGKVSFKVFHLVVCQIPYFKRASMREGTEELDVINRTCDRCCNGNWSEHGRRRVNVQRKVNYFLLVLFLFARGWLPLILAFLGGHHEGFWFPTVATGLQGFLILLSHESKPSERTAGSTWVFPTICLLVELPPPGSLNM